MQFYFWSPLPGQFLMSWHPVITNQDIQSLFEHFSCWRKWKVISGKLRFLSKNGSCCQEWKIWNQEKIYTDCLIYCLQNCTILTDLCLSITSKQERIWTGAGWSVGLKPILARRAFFGRSLQNNLELSFLFWARVDWHWHEVITLVLLLSLKNQRSHRKMRFWRVPNLANFTLRDLTSLLSKFL